MYPELSNKRALILGGNCTPAFLLVSKLMQQGSIPILSYRNKDSWQHIREALQEEDFETCQLDFNDYESLQNLESHISSGIDLLVDFAHTELEKLVASATDESIYSYFSANVSFRTALLKRVAKSMLANRQGRMIFISSTAVERQNPGQGFYAASKSACEAIYRNIGLEMGQNGISTTILRPGYMDSGRGRRFLQEQGNERKSSIASTEIISPEDLVETVCFLLSGSGISFNACALRMDGGLCSRK